MSWKVESGEPPKEEKDEAVCLRRDTGLDYKPSLLD